MEPEILRVINIFLFTSGNMCLIDDPSDAKKIIRGLIEARHSLIWMEIIFNDFYNEM